LNCVSDEPNTTSENPTPTPLPAVAIGSTVDAPHAEEQRKSKRPGVEAGGYFWGTGRRKRAVARVRIKPGTGKFTVNEKEADTYFCAPRHRMDVVAPLKATKSMGKFDIIVKVHGGGQTGQAGAVLLGLARALMTANGDFEASLRDGGYLTRDPRKVERKKPGQPGARKRFQFSKR
jgi:small subunit ribosomal protein S9